ncbi:MAG: alpha/beta fold hydrolase [Beijerinckiaceae bacterium]
MPDTGFSSFYATAPDGLRLHGRDYGSRLWTRTPLICLPGLSRTAADFHELALALSQHSERPRRVLALDYRGRGMSDHDPRWMNYDPYVEAGDTLAFLTAAGVHEAAFLGTSRGGLITMGLSAMRPALLRAAILNDIGPVVDAKGLVRIRSYVGKMPSPRNFEEAADILKQFSGAQFPILSEQDWMRVARKTWAERDGRLVSQYDVNLMRTLEMLDLEKPLPVLWPLFEGLRDIPTLAIRGAHSDILAQATLDEMVARHPRCEGFVVPGQGHAPWLDDMPSILKISDFLARTEDGTFIAHKPAKAA